MTPPDLELTLDGQPTRITVAAAEVASLHVPLLQDLEKKWRVRRGRFIVFLSGPPGAGKTALAALWEHLARQGRVAVPIQALPMDGFHFPNHVLESRWIELDGRSVCLRQIKGRPETFDLPLLQQSLRALKAGEEVLWPAYDRSRHDPLPGATAVLRDGILVVEGLYMLLDLPGWEELRDWADYGIFLECPEELLRADLLARKHQQGRSCADAAAHYDLVDHYTWHLLAQRRRGIDLVIQVRPGRRLEVQKSAVPLSPPVDAFSRCGYSMSG